MNDSARVVALRWFSGVHNPLSPSFPATVGIVALLDDDPEGPYFKVYLGLGEGHSAEADARWIADWGVPIADELLARNLAGGLGVGRIYRT